MEQSLQNILDYLDRNHLPAFKAATQIIIAPGYEFKIVKAMVTNFHQPQNTLMLLVAAFVGEGLETDLRLRSFPRFDF